MVRTLRLFPLKAKDEVRAATCSSGTLASASISSSVIPSEKYSVSRSALRLTNGSTATDFEMDGGGATRGAALSLRCGACAQRQ